MNGSSMPSVTNWPLYVYRIFMKAWSFFVFGAAALFLVFPLMPVLSLLIRDNEKLQRFTRRMVSGWFRIFIRMMEALGIVILEADEARMLKDFKSKIVVSNHPSLLDMIMVISLIPNADVIVRGDLNRNFFLAGVVTKLYILASADFDDIAAAAKKSLERGNCIVIFPEGTRTPRGGKMRLKKGAARLSLLCGAEIAAVRIGGTDKYGLGKRDPFLSFNHREKYIYRVKFMKMLNPAKYSSLENYRAVRRLNEEMLEIWQNPEA